MDVSDGDETRPCCSSTLCKPGICQEVASLCLLLGGCAPEGKTSLHLGLAHLRTAVENLLASTEGVDPPTNGSAEEGVKTNGDIDSEDLSNKEKLEVKLRNVSLIFAR